MLFSYFKYYNVQLNNLHVLRLKQVTTYVRIVNIEMVLVYVINVEKYLLLSIILLLFVKTKIDVIQFCYSY